MNTPPPFERFNEADVREEVIAPLLRRLGYQSGSVNDIIREQSLCYPKLSLGRKNPRRDPELRGKADYILEVKKRLRWVVEAKAPSVIISDDDIEQAWSYANHPEIRALYFVICNGRVLIVHRTAHGPGAPEVLTLPYEGLDTDFQLLANVLGPEALARDFPDLELDVGLPIAPGLRSLARITNGAVRYEQNSLGSPVLNELQYAIQDGAIERGPENNLVVFVKGVAPSRSLQEFNERLGLSVFEMSSDSTELSTDVEHPTKFVYKSRVILPAGEQILDITTWNKVRIPCNLTCEIEAQAAGSFRDGIFSGSFTTSIHCMESRLNVNMSGRFEVSLA